MVCLKWLQFIQRLEAEFDRAPGGGFFIGPTAGPRTGRGAEFELALRGRLYAGSRRATFSGDMRFADTRGTLGVLRPGE